MGTLESAIRPQKRSGSQPAAVPAPAPAPVGVQPRLSLDDPVTTLKGAGGATSKKLAKLGVETVGDLLLLAPRRHIDYSRTIRIGEALNLRPGSDVTVRGRVTDVQLHRGPGAPRVTIRLADTSGWVRVTWFNQYLANVLHVGDEIAVSGALEAGYGPLSFTSPEWERVGLGAGGGVSTGRIVPVYPLTAGLAQKSLRGFARQALDLALDAVEEYLPEHVRLKQDEPLPTLRDAVAQIHFPDDEESLKAAKRRLAFDDLFLLQLGLARRKQERQAYDGIPIAAERDLLRRWETGLPFQLTGAQRSALAEVLEDMSRAKPMARLLQGDVGSGKTAVAAAAMLAATANGLQAALMAPTEILAEQHLQNLEMLYSGLPDSIRPRVRLLTGSTRATVRREIFASLESGETNVMVGTHALIQEGVEIPRLARHRRRRAAPVRRAAAGGPAGQGGGTAAASVGDDRHADPAHAQPRHPRRPRRLRPRRAASGPHPHRNAALHRRRARGRPTASCGRKWRRVTRSSSSALWSKPRRRWKPRPPSRRRNGCARTSSPSCASRRCTAA